MVAPIFVNLNHEINFPVYEVIMITFLEGYYPDLLPTVNLKSGCRHQYMYSGSYISQPVPNIDIECCHFWPHCHLSRTETVAVHVLFTHIEKALFNDTNKTFSKIYIFLSQIQYL